MGLIVYALHKSKAVAGSIFTKLEAVRLFFVCSFYTKFNENPTYGLVVHTKPQVDGRVPHLKSYFITPSSTPELT